MQKEDIRKVSSFLFVKIYIKNTLSLKIAFVMYILFIL
ncbi:Uncharacterised protein [Sphingobacterium spiritivorum]|uniref:Uncharacterized protein n=1 Tax=Sphingobacterium spiritivorum TaxID=258 RepID=A0A380CUY8_SPHSI|nr:Uncharacterised protein [Sphingobacterium spiritivorum]